MRRFALLPAVTGLVILSLAGCGSDEGSAFDTLPTIRTTTSTTSTTVPVDDRRKFYEVKAGDNLAEIARSFQVPKSEIVRINNLPDNGEIIQIGQILEIPTDVVLIDTLPTPESTELP
jgi:LysM repeat protein